jgi:hypothetical protein
MKIVTISIRIGVQVRGQSEGFLKMDHILGPHHPHILTITSTLSSTVWDPIVDVFQLHERFWSLNQVNNYLMWLATKIVILSFIIRVEVQKY